MIRRLLVALDGSAGARTVLSGAADLAEALYATMYLLRVITIPPEFPPAAYTTQRDTLPAFMEREAHDAMRALVLAESRAEGCQLIVRQGSQTWQAILDVADEVRADLIIVGSHGREALDRVIGTTAGRVASLARRNVLVIHNWTPRETQATADGPYRSNARPGIPWT